MSEITACARCASTHLRMPGFADGSVPETDNLAEWVCRECGLRAIPIAFDRASDYEAFAKDRRADAEAGD